MTDRLDLRPILSLALLFVAAGCAGTGKSKSTPTASLESHPGDTSAAPTASAAPAPAPAPARQEAKPETPYESKFDHVVMGMFGLRMMDEDDWAPVEEPKTGGINYMGRGPGGWFHWDFSITFGDDSGTAIVELDGEDVLIDASTKVWEADFGLAKIINLGVLRPYIGVGVAVVNIDAEVVLQNGASASEDNTTIGGYGRAGIAFQVTKSGGVIGFEARYLAGTDISIAGVDTDVDGLTGLVTVGFSW